MRATLTAPVAPADTWHAAGSFVWDTLAAHDAGGPVPPWARLHAVGPGGVTVDVQPVRGAVVHVEVPDGGSVPLACYPGWSARCGGVAPDLSEAAVWLEHDGVARERPGRAVERSPF